MDEMRSIVTSGAKLAGAYTHLAVPINLLVNRSAHVVTRMHN
jgi:hypothetical protein